MKGEWQSFHARTVPRKRNGGGGGNQTPKHYLTRLFTSYRSFGEAKINDFAQQLAQSEASKFRSEKPGTHTHADGTVHSNDHHHDEHDHDHNDHAEQVNLSEDGLNPDDINVIRKRKL